MHAHTTIIHTSDSSELLRDLAQSLAIMDIDIISAPLLKCFICEDSEKPARKLVLATPKGYPTLLAYAEAIGDATVSERMKEAWSVGSSASIQRCMHSFTSSQIIQVRLKITFCMRGDGIM